MLDPGAVPFLPPLDDQASGPPTHAAPVENPVAEVDAPVDEVPVAAPGFELEAWYHDHCLRGHPFDGRCDHCVRGRLRDRAARRVGSADRAAGEGYVMSADFTGIHDPDLDGHRVALVASVHSYGRGDCDPDAVPEAAYGFVALLADRKTTAVAAALDNFDLELTRLGRDKDRSIIRFHTDVDKSFLGKVQRLAVRKGWVQTDTGGYRSRANAIVERRIGMLKQTSRTLLLSAAGDASFYVDLWGHAMLHANFCCNVNNWTSRPSPYQQWYLLRA